VRREREGSERRVFRAAAIRVVLESVLFSLSLRPVVPSSGMIGYYQAAACGILVTRDEIPPAAIVDPAEYHFIVRHLVVTIFQVRFKHRD